MNRYRLLPLCAVVAALLILAGCEEQPMTATDGAFDKPTPEATFDEPPSDRPTSHDPDPAPTMGMEAGKSNVIPGQYIVVFHDDVSNARALSQTLADAHGAATLHRYDAALKGFAARLSDRAVEALRRNPNVAFVEPDREAFALAEQPNPPSWGLDRIDQRNLPLDNSYTYNFDGSGVTAYIIDTGIRTTHNDFGGRASVGYDAIGDGQNGQDCNGHGTHVAGTVGGSAHGVAKNVALVAVRVLNCSGSGSYSQVIAGVDWVTANASGPSVANMSLGGPTSTALDNAVRNSIAAGITYAVAAGNSNANACNASPARVDEALTVGSTTSSDNRSSFSNYGTCVDIFAPGSSITSAWHTSNSATNTISGTSMASPHVAGVAALYLDENPGASPATVFSAITTNATQGAVSNPGSGSPNLLLYSLFGSNPDPDPDPDPDPAPCTGCEQYSGSLSGSGDSDYQPNGTYYFSGSGTHRGYLRGPASADFDLYLYKWSGWRWRIVASSTSASSDEDIVYSGSSGYYTWRIYSYSGSGAYDFWLDRP